jgi:ABC-type glutathione transport system ATPase component
MSVPPAVAVIEAEDLVKEYPPARRGLRLHRGEPLRAVDGVSLTLRQGRTLALVGESGSGKSTTARMILLLERPTAGRLRFDGEDMLAAGGVALRRYRASVQAVFQDPWSSLNPRMSVGWIVREPLVLNTRLSAREVDERRGRP